MSDYLYITTIPVLLLGKREAGRMAKQIWCQYGLTAHWFGSGYHYLLTAYAQKHPIPKGILLHGDELLTQILIDFAKEQTNQGILALIPCSTEAVEYMARQKDVLETYFCFMPQNLPLHDPLLPLTQP